MKIKRQVKIFFAKDGGPLVSATQPRNEKCRCGSGKKFKNCHLGTIDEYYVPKRLKKDKF